MRPGVDETHDPALTSWVESANAEGTDFPLQNLPFAVFRRAGSRQAWRGGVAIGDQVLDLAALQAAGVADGRAAEALALAAGETLNPLMAAGRGHWQALRQSLSRLLRAGALERRRLEAALVPQAAAEFTLPAQIGDYTDFYTSIHHATNVGKLFRPDHPLLPNYKWVPIGYHGRASSIVVSGTGIRRPCGQLMRPDAEYPELAPTRRMDFELELGLFVGPGNALGEPVPIGAAEDRIFGVCLLDDWSARDLQAWEYQPLGPFLAKNFATTISPWVVTLEALAPFRVGAARRPAGDPRPLPYLDSPAAAEVGAVDLQLSVELQTAAMRARGEAGATISRTSWRHAYWTMAQLVAHHSVNGCNLRPGDLLGTGTLSGPTPGEAGALIELSVGGKRPVGLPGGEQRCFLEDGDAVVLRGWCEAPGRRRIGLGECRGTVLPAAR
ncbi:fumarylacetoacetase [Rubrivivax gelatinosus]|uniref:fumarylacetoacetase n=2 Tax=Rubrivivax gelatinosus TaxID=28068 RepID=UPI0018C929EC|nr:fumarylacetoacetase [Rubrivivax gelatinosus]MBG6082545.1 fumarylacetoacetase [Rubrivivax gelatinosus]